jgi:hypothetical protein
MAALITYGCGQPPWKGAIHYRYLDDAALPVNATSYVYGATEQECLLELLNRREQIHAHTQLLGGIITATTTCEPMTP